MLARVCLGAQGKRRAGLGMRLCALPREATGTRVYCMMSPCLGMDRSVRA